MGYDKRAHGPSRLRRFATSGLGRSGPRSASLISRLRYRFDLALARGPLVVIGYLGLVMLGIILVSAFLLAILRLKGIDGAGRLDFAQALWQSLLRVLDTGTFASDLHWPVRIISLFVTVSGIFLAGSLIGLIANAVDQQIDKLRKGRSDVLESGHTLVLGWSPRLPAILAELVIANANHRDQAFVVLADRAKDEMEDELRRLVPDTKTTRVVCRTGDSGSASDLSIVNIADSRSVIVLAGESGDAGVVRAVLAVRSLDPDFDHTKLVAELEHPEHALTLRNLTDGRISTVLADDVIAQVTAQACHQIGMAAVFRDLLDFDGDEIYFAQVPELSGHTYREALGAFPEACVIGFLRAGTVSLNPPPDHVFAAGDEVIAIAGDDDRITFGGFVERPPMERLDASAWTRPTERIAVIGWSSLGETVLHELFEFLGHKSMIDLMVDRTLFRADEVSVPTCEHCDVTVHLLDPEPQALLAVLRRARYDQVIVLGYRRRMNAAEADAASMLTLLALHRAWSDDADRPRVVAEMLDRANVGIAQSIGVDDFIVSDELTSLMLAQLSERRELQYVFAALFAPDGVFLSLHPASLYTQDRPTTFASIVATAVDRGVTAVGYQVRDSPVRINPAKTQEIQLDAADRIVVLAPRTPRPASL